MMGVLSLCTKEDIQNYALSSKIIVLDETAVDIIHMYKASLGSILQPPYLAMCDYIDGNINGFIMQYKNHLCSLEVSEFLAVICRALLNGTNISIYVSSEEMSMQYPIILLQYLFERFGIQTKTSIVDFSFNINYISFIMDLLYQFDLCNSNELFMNVVPNYQFSQATLNKLISEYNPYMNNYTYNDYMNYFINLSNKSKQVGTTLQPLLSRKEN